MTTAKTVNDQADRRLEPAGDRERGTARGAATGWLLGAASLVGLSAFFYPFLLPALVEVGVDARTARGVEAPLVLAVVTLLCLVVIVAELGSAGTRRGEAAKIVALLGVLVAADALLRLAPSLVGASPIFLLIILVGSTFGGSFGFLMGALTLLLSAFITGGLGPWLPFQMLGAGWVGLTAGWLPKPTAMRHRLLVLALFGAAWGLLFGALLNLYAWPFAAPGLAQDAGLYWFPGLGLVETVERYAAFYLVTSLGHDLFRAVGNAALILLLGAPLLRVLERYRARFAWQPWVRR